MSSGTAQIRIPERSIEVIENGGATPRGWVPFDLGRDFEFSTEALETYAFASWEPVIYDAMVVAAAIEYGDRILKRPPRGWARRIALRIPVHDPDRWNDSELSAALLDAAGFLTGDYWSVEFVARAKAAPSPHSDYLNLPVPTEAVLAFSDGMDSRAVAGLIGSGLGPKLVRVRVGSNKIGRPDKKNRREPFTMVPYDVPCNMPNREASARSRGFKFALISGIAAYLSGAGEIVIPESGQGAIGPAIAPVVHAYPDYRNHPRFTQRMERLLKALFGKEIRYVFPRLWNTKGETLRSFAALPEGSDWHATRSCWRSNRWSSVNGKRRQCGVCAACMLRRLSVHAAGLTEADDAYVCTDLTAVSLEEAVDPDFTRMTPAYRQYAIAGVLHMDHLADLASKDGLPVVRRHAALLGPALGLGKEQTEESLTRMLSEHAGEWKEFVRSMGSNSFIRQWVRAGL